jgi:hypothetical protein
MCAECTHHQGEQDAKRFARAERHERMLGERLTACRASESRARSEAAQARSEAARAREATASALRTRARLAVRLAEAADESGNHRCAAMGIARDPQVTGWAREAEGDTRSGW